MKQWQILKNGRRRDFAVIILITAIFVLMVTLNVRLIFQMTSNQTEEIGQTQLEVIRSEFQGIIYQAEEATARVAMEAEQLLKSRAPLEEIEDFFVKRKAERKNLTDGVCFNTYIAGKDWSVIPDFDMPPDYHAPERIWYKGASEKVGEIYITEPYVDAMTGDMCYTISKMLSDGETVVAQDFTFADVHQFIRKMSTTSDRKALIVTANGMIIGYTDMSLVGRKISDKLPEYEKILNRVVQSDHSKSFITQIDGEEHTIFSSATTNGWYIIFSVNNRAFYRDSYEQIFLTALISLIMLVTIIFLYLNAMRNGLLAENALRAKEEFLSRLSGELRDPLRNILKISNKGVLHMDDDPAECAAEVRESALKLSDMLDNLFSFSTIVARAPVEKILQDEELSKVSRYARQGIAAVLILAMVVAFGICLTTTISWGDTKMQREIDTYESQLSEWIADQRGTLKTFVNLLSEHPELMSDYPSAVEYLDDLARHYPEISVCYMSNPYAEHQVIMNNGWESPDPNWRVDQRPWYIEAEKSPDGFSISSPYYDAQTGIYCVTMAQMVFGPKGEFVGVFGIDFYLDRLTKVLGESYTADSYAFLVDKNGVIINHPNKNYQQTDAQMTNIFDTEYAKVYDSAEITTLTDYTGNSVACLAKKNKISSFTVIVVNDWWNIYGSVIVLGVLFAVLLGVCIAIVNTLISRQLRWQASANRKLKEASETALAASQSKSQFLAQMSHEIRTPINAVLGMNEMILRESESDEVLEYATNIQSAGRTLLTLINSLLDFSKIEDGKMEIVPVRYETVALIDDFVNMILDKAQKKGLEFRTEISSKLPCSLYGDDVRIRQVITNILTNAVKYTHAGHVTLKISGTEIDADTFELRVEVSDTGIGIRAEDMSKLFQSFQRLDEERNRNIEGTGLGIAIVQKLLAMMGSQLEVESVYGSGSDFSFKLTQKIIDKNPIGDYSAIHLKRFDKSAQKKFLLAEGAKILVVDDNDMNLKVISGLLKRNKIIPDLAESGQQGIELARKNFYHIIFLDNMMPRMTGVEALKIMQQEKFLSSETSVIMLTASAIAGMREKYLQEGFNDYLSKPIEVDELEEMLAKHLPPELVSFEVEKQRKITPAAPVEEPAVEESAVEEPAVEEPADEESADEDTFTAKERARFAEICPDINLDTALQYSMDSKSFLEQIMETYTDAKRAEKLQAAFESGDVKNYQVLVHALKSTSMSIGAEKLSAAARELELAAAANDVAKIQANHGDLMAGYQKVCEQITRWLEA